MVCIQCRLEKTLIKTETPLSNSLSKSFKSDFDFKLTKFSNEQPFNSYDLNKISFNSKGTLNGFISGSERFINEKKNKILVQINIIFELNNLLKNIEKTIRAKDYLNHQNFIQLHQIN